VEKYSDPSLKPQMFRTAGARKKGNIESIETTLNSGLQEEKK